MNAICGESKRRMVRSFPLAGQNAVRDEAAERPFIAADVRDRMARRQVSQAED